VLLNSSLSRYFQEQIETHYNITITLDLKGKEYKNHKDYYIN